FGGGQLGPFGHACAVAGSSKMVIVADTKPASGVTTVYAYQQIEGKHPSTKLLFTYPLPDIPTSAHSHCQLAVGGDFAYFGTDQTSTFAQVNLVNGSLWSGQNGGGNTTSITANDRLVVV